MIIPAIDFEAGEVVQLVQGERRALRRDLEPTLEEFRGFPLLQIIDLDAAKGEGSNAPLVRRCCQAGYRVRVGGGIRSLERARAVLEDGAEQVIVGSAAFHGGELDEAFLDSLLGLGRERILLAVDARDGRVVTHGWRRPQPWTPVQAVRALGDWCGGFLYTHVESEGLMRGIPLEAVRAVRAATELPLSVAGGIADADQITELTAMGCDCVLGMALYTGRLDRTWLLDYSRAASQ